MKVFMNLHFVIIFIASNIGWAQNADHFQTETVKNEDVIKIWDKAPHNAFTDLIRYNNAFYCTFREASGHVVNKGQQDGKIRIIKSDDGIEWISVALLEKRGLDLRDPKLSITPDGRLMVIMGGSIYREGEMLERIPQVAFSDETGANFSTPQNVIIDEEVHNKWDWIWRVTWNDDKGYAINWQLQNWGSGVPTGTIYLMETNDGVHYKKLSYLEVFGYPNESTIRFGENDKMFVLIRRERGDNGEGIPIMATSIDRYDKWEFEALTEVGRIGGPNFIFLNDKTLAVSGRGYNKVAGNYTRLDILDLKGRLRKKFILPSGEDNSYPGLVLYDGKLWLSYYSGHDGKTSIYLTSIPISKLGVSE